MRDDGTSVLDKFRQGDEVAFETLFRMHQRSVYGGGCVLFETRRQPKM